jgi:hypothetical protein
MTDVLPVDDPVIPTLTASARRAAAQAWAWRAASEKTAAIVFERIAEGLARDGATVEVLALASAAVDEERAHADLAHAVACRYAGAALPAPQVRTLDMPRFGAADARTCRLLFLVLHSCINETVAAAYLRACLQEARAPSARAAVRLLLADEMNHARIGWAHLASPHVGPADRAHVHAALPVLLRLARAAWRAPIPDTVGLEAGHGCLTEASSLATVTEALERIVLPGFEGLGLGTAD